MPGGLFLFDVNTPEKLRSLDGQVFLDETEDTYCVWRADYLGAPPHLHLRHGPVFPGAGRLLEPGGGAP
ncbi:MAG: hypothetical protein ACLU9S_09910 [Oscillospiraceae bacterium]